MAVAVVYKSPAITLDQYQQSWRSGPPVAPPAGLLFHAGMGEGEDFMTVTVWESVEAYDAFAPIFARAMALQGFNFGSPQILPVHRFLTGTTK